MSQLAHIEDESSAMELSPRGNPTDILLNAIVNNKLSPENAKGAFELYKDMAAMQAKQQFAAAFAKLQADLPRIVATRIIPGNDNSIRSTFAAFEDIMEKIAPFLDLHGFSVSFDSETGDKMITAICILSHMSGHSEQRRFAVHISAPPKASVAQADGATLTYAKRMALCNAFNITVTHDDDARNLGDFISKEQAESLRQRVQATNSDEALFFKMAKASAYEEIRTGQYMALDAVLLRKARKMAGQ